MDAGTYRAVVTLDAKGGTLSGDFENPFEVTAGGTIAALPEPTRYGYDFAAGTPTRRLRPCS